MCICAQGSLGIIVGWLVGWLLAVFALTEHDILKGCRRDWQHTQRNVICQVQTVAVSVSKVAPLTAFQEGGQRYCFITLLVLISGSSIVALAVSREYHVVCCRQQSMQLHEIHVLELFEARGKGDYLRTVRGCVHDRVTSLHVNLMGSHALAVCTMEKQQMSDMAVWNLETEDHKHLARHPLTATAAACLDFRFCLTAAKGQNSLRMWNLSGKVGCLLACLLSVPATG